MQVEYADEEILKSGLHYDGFNYGSKVEKGKPRTRYVQSCYNCDKIYFS